MSDKDKTQFRLLTVDQKRILFPKGESDIARYADCCEALRLGLPHTCGDGLKHHGVDRALMLKEAKNYPY